jgi:hypothetical protein
MPGCRGQLICDDSRSAAVTLFEDFEQILAGVGAERLEAEVVEN